MGCVWFIYRKIRQQLCLSCNTGMSHPLGMVPHSEAPHLVNPTASGFYPSFASTFFAHTFAYIRVSARLIINEMTDNKKTYATLFMRISKFDNASACWSCLSEGRILTKDSNNTSSAWIKCHTHCCSKDSHSRVLSGYKWNQEIVNNNTPIILTSRLKCTTLWKQGIENTFS